MRLLLNNDACFSPFCNNKKNTYKTLQTAAKCLNMSYFTTLAKTIFSISIFPINLMKSNFAAILVAIFVDVTEPQQRHNLLLYHILISRTHRRLSINYWTNFFEILLHLKTPRGMIATTPPSRHFSPLRFFSDVFKSICCWLVLSLLAACLSLRHTLLKFSNNRLLWERYMPS